MTDNDIRARIKRRAKRIQRERVAGLGLWRRLREFFGGPSLDTQVRQVLREREEAQTRANREFDRPGPTSRDVLRGGRYERVTGRKYDGGDFLAPGGATRLIESTRN